jgi:hypothetical protein
MTVDDSRSAVRFAAEPEQDVPILVMEGVLDSSTYRSARDVVIKAALDEPLAVIADVNELSVPSASAWSVFTSARWHVRIWPGVPILIVCGQTQTRRAIAARGVDRYVPVHPTREAALNTVPGRPLPVRRRARTELPIAPVSIDLARAMVIDRLTRWDARDLIPVAATVATVLVENVIDHTDSAPVLIVESYRDAVTVAVEDGSDRLPERHEGASRGAELVSGLAIVSALCRAWGTIPTPTGKSVWGLVGRENQL